MIQLTRTHISVTARQALAVVALLIVTVGLAATVGEAQGPVTWTEYIGNPVFGQGVGGPKAYYPSILYDESGFSGHGTAADYKCGTGPPANKPAWQRPATGETG